MEINLIDFISTCFYQYATLLFTSHLHHQLQPVIPFLQVFFLNLINFALIELSRPSLELFTATVGYFQTFIEPAFFLTPPPLSKHH